MRLIAPLLALALLTACGMPKRESGDAVEPVVVAEEPAAVYELDCQTGDDDGIGGTGCQLD